MFEGDDVVRCAAGSRVMCSGKKQQAPDSLVHFTRDNIDSCKQYVARANTQHTHSLHPAYTQDTRSMSTFYMHSRAHVTVSVHPVSYEAPRV